ncbi:DUF6088 family protein [Dyadobacter sp. CY261]|uniref:DUF6088 family protein n=1 Tax=Dyadobacter sp. CY261 TaxID=2907203 RepID=UPI001F180E52|nr:DUF6088 family protein [Dyadobacter sp. CY261]MCF0075763.1 DUF6088 family protein [Dyadobacter sp. CY261]
MGSVSEKIAERIKAISEDMSFGYEELPIEPDEFWSAAKAIERLQKKGVIRKLSKGRFYKPKMTVFGEKRPDEQEILRPYLYRQGKRIAYITGMGLYNRLNLTTQIPAVIHIASCSRRSLTGIGYLRVKPVKSYVDVSEENYQILGFLDALKDLRRIPDLDISAGMTLFKSMIKALGLDQQDQMITLALSYPPRVRALLGAILEDIMSTPDLRQLKESLNPFTRFALGVNSTVLKTAPTWNIQ